MSGAPSVPPSSDSADDESVERRLRADRKASEEALQRKHGVDADITQRTRAEEALRESEARYRSLFENMLDGFAYCQMLFDEHGQPDDFVYLAVNDTFGRLTGLENVTGKRVTQVIPGIKELNPEVFETYGRVASTGNPEQFEIDLKPLGLLLSISVYCPTKGYFVAVFDDITERKRAEETLRESEQRFRLMADELPLMIWVYDAQGQLQFVNQTYREFFGVTPQQVAGPNWQPRVHPDDAAAYANEFIACVRNRRPFHAEVRVCRFDGEWRWIESRAQPRFSASGEFLGMVGSSPDITERKRAEDALRESEERYRAATTAVSDVIWTNNAEGLMEGEQRGWAAFTGQSREEYRGYGWAKAVHPEDAQPTIEAWARAVVEKRTFVFEHRVRRHDGEWRVCSVRAVPVLNADGTIREWVGVHQDITERNHAEVKLRQLAADLSESDRRKSEFLAMLAHELRNPLAPMRNMLQVLKFKGDDQGAVANASAIIERQVGQMVRLVDDLLDVSRVSRGKIELRKERVALSSIIRQAEEAVWPLCEGVNHELTVALPSRPVEVNGDPVRLIQIVSNLLTNACKFTDAGGRIWLSVERDAEQAVIRVRDTGIGISADNLPRLFQIFMQADTSLDRTAAGLGIGLTLVKDLVEMHDGTVEANSEGIGRGSEFVLRLPALPAEPQAQPAAPALPNLAENATASKRSLRILVVDDNQDSANSMALLLKFAGHLTHTAYDGLEAVETAATFRPDVVLLDIGLPTLNGHEVCRRIRQQTSDQTIRLIALTGWGQDEDRQRTAEAGFDAHLVKPVDFNDLLKLMAK